jgi:hypothetical protein
MRVKVVGVLLIAALVSAAPAVLRADDPPSDEAIEFAQEASDLLLAELLAALLQQFSETTPDNVAQGSLAISLVFDDSHDNFRLVGTFEPLGNDAGPQDDFEEAALAAALQGQTSEALDEVDDDFFWRRSIPLSNFDPSCELCHSNFGPVDPTFYTGALMLKVPVESDSDSDDSDSDSDD